MRFVFSLFILVACSVPSFGQIVNDPACCGNVGGFTLSGNAGAGGVINADVVGAAPGTVVSYIVTTGGILNPGMGLGSLGTLLINALSPLATTAIFTDVADGAGTSGISWTLPTTNPTNEDAIVLQACFIDAVSGQPRLSNRSFFIVGF